ncbi:LSU ribosomal protein L9 [Candidatus Phytoplasma fraxini]|uniref:Large ribosomal subunit protein bL9 n=2 Tax=Ash yellows phytoplasma TaxID=35780 RepID=A0ABZ2U8A5_ASHYP
MKIILLEDIPNKGKKYDIIKINSGYGNFLIKEKKAFLAIKNNIQKIQTEQMLQEEENKKNNLLMQQLKKDIDNKQIDIMSNFGPTGKMYGKITSQQIIDEFHIKHNILINKKKVIVDKKINSLGTYKAKVILTKDIIASFFINIKDAAK